MTINIPLSVSEYAGIRRVDEPLTSGVPIPECANIMSVLDLEVCDSNNNRIPAQFTVLSRWHGVPDDETKPIKWVLLDFNADVDLGGTSIYYLRDGAGDSTQNTNLNLVEDDNTIVVNTGVATFTINKNYFNLFDYVNIDGKNIVSQPNAGGVVLTDINGKIFTTLNESPEEIFIEEVGVQRAVIKIRGVFKAEDHTYFARSVHFPEDTPKFDQPYENSFFYYNCRIHFYNNKEYVKLFLTIENNGANGYTDPEWKYAPRQPVNFDSIDLVINKSSNNTTISSEDGTSQLTHSDVFTILQNWKDNLTDSYGDTLEPIFEKGIYYTSKKNDNEISAGLMNPGWVDSYSPDNSSGVGFAVRHFWQNFPKKITADHSMIKIGLWPKEGYFPYWNFSTTFEPQFEHYTFEAGRHKTYEMIIRFYSDSEDNQTQTISKSMESPLVALPDSAWVAETKALGLIGPSGIESDDIEMKEALERFERFQTSTVYEDDSYNGVAIPNIRTRNPPVNEWERQSMFFNWANFGDLLWMNHQPCSTHYDWTYKMLLHYIRTGKRRLFDVGVEMAKHRYDIDQYHGERSSTDGMHKWANHLQFYEKDSNGSTKGKISKPTHNWNGGIILYYLLTGDRKSLEAAEENSKGILNHFGDGGLFNASYQGKPHELRSEGWSMLNLVEIYRVTGEQKYLDVAKNIAKNRVMYTEQQSGGRGVILGGTPPSPLHDRICGIVDCECVELDTDCYNVMLPLMLAYTSEGLIAVHHETQDKELGDMLIRTGNFLKDEMLFGGDYNEDGLYRTLRTANVWVKEDIDGSIRLGSGHSNSYHYGFASPIYTLFWSNLFAYAYRLTKNSEYLDWARKCFKDMMFHHISQGYVDPGQRDMITFKDNMWGSTHTKVHGWIGRTNQVYLNTEWELQHSQLIDGDLNQDSSLNIIDYKLMCDALGKQIHEVGYSKIADYDNNDKVTYSDFKEWYNYYQNI